MAQLVEDRTVDGFVDHKHRPAVRSKHGNWRSSFFIIGVEMGERFSYYGISANLISFLTLKLGQSTATAAENISAWAGVGYMLPTFGGVIADTYLGKYYTIIVSSIIYILGLGLLAISAILPSHDCTNNETTLTATDNPKCSTQLQTIIFFIALYMVAIGQGGHKPCTQSFGADQFDGDDPDETKAKSSFFNWWYFGIAVGGFLGVVVLSYTQDNLSWGLGFGIPCTVMIIVLSVFLLGTYTYRFSTKSKGDNPFRRIGRVFMTAARNWQKPYPVSLGEGDNLMAQAESRKYRFLDKALIVPTHGDWKECSKNDVEEAKAVLRLFPIWITSFVFAIVLSQPPTFFTRQGMTLDRSIGSKVQIPPAALQALMAIVSIIFIPIYDRIIVPLARASTGNPAGVTMLQRIGIGFFLSIFCMIIAALVEIKRLKIASENALINLPKAVVPMNIWWLVPQYAVFGIAEAFSLVGLQEFFYDQVPNDLKSVGASLYLSIFGMGSLISSVLVKIIDKETSKGGRHSWFSTNLNQGHLDYFYWVLSGASTLGLLFFMCVARSYVYNKSKAPL